MGTVRNLDTGEIRKLELEEFEEIPPLSNFSLSTLTESFQGQPTMPTTLSGAAKPWSSWWRERKRQDEQLWMAAKAGNLDEVKRCLDPPDGEPPASINSKSLHNQTALHMAASAGSQELIAALLEALADIAAKTNAGLTPLHMASQRGHKEAALCLIESGSDIRWEAEDGSLPMHLAASGGFAEVVALLLDRGGSEQLSCRNRCGQRPEEVCMDYATSQVFANHTQGGSDWGRSNTVDEILLHNSRSDFVKKLLHRVNKEPREITATTEDAWKPKEISKVDPKREHFVKVKEDDHVQSVGPDSFVCDRLLGKGSFGEVFCVRHKVSQTTYAMKVLQKSKVLSGNLLSYVLTERNILSFIHHPYIVTLHYAFQTSSHLVLVLSFCPNGNLQALITKQTNLEERVARLYAAEILLALVHLHQRDIIFRDLKPDNVGLKGARSYCGSPAFIAPEILQRRGHGKTVDIYGLGVLLHHMLVGMPPFYNPDRGTLESNIKFKRLTIPSKVGEDAKNLILSVMERDPAKRLGAADTADVQSHAFFESVDFAALLARGIPVPGYTPSDDVVTEVRGPGFRQRPPSNIAPGPSRNDDLPQFGDFAAPNQT